MAEEIQRLLINAIDALNSKFLSLIAQLKQDVSATQAEASQEVFRRLDKQLFQF